MAMKPKFTLLAAVSLGAVGLFIGGHSTLSFPSASAQADSRPVVEAAAPRRAALAKRLRSNATLSAYEEADRLPKLQVISRKSELISAIM